MTVTLHSQQQEAAIKEFTDSLKRIERVRGQPVRPPCEDDPELWWTYNLEEELEATAQCERCLLQDECLKIGLARPRARAGIWGGVNMEKPNMPAKICAECDQAYRSFPRDKGLCQRCASSAKKEVAA